MRLIDADALKEALDEQMNNFEENCRDSVFDIIDNAPTVEPFEHDYVGAERLKARQRGYEEGYHNGMAIGKTLNPKIKQGECEKCTYRIFTKKFANSISEIMAQYGITSIEELQERLQSEMRGKKNEID